MIKAVIFDLDGTLIDTHALKEKMFEFLFDRGFGAEQAKKIYERARDENGKNKFTLQSFRTEIEKEIRLEDNVWDFFLQSLRLIGKNIGIASAKEVFKFFNDINIPAYILTLGQRAWQEEKIKMAGLDEYVIRKENIKFTAEVSPKNGKIKEIRDIMRETGAVSGAEIIFFNDKPDETAAVMAEIKDLKVFVRREPRDQRYIDDDYNKLLENNNVCQVSDRFDFLEKIKKII